MDWFDTFHALIGADGEEIGVLQMILRGVVVLVIGFVLIRVATPRIFSKTTPIDIVVAVIIGSNLSRTMTGGAPFLPVIAATFVLVLLHAAVTRLASYWRPFATLIKGRACVLAEDGEIDWKQMHRCAVGKRDLLAAVRAAGGTDLDEIRLATLERGGEVEVVLGRDRG